MTHYDDWYAGRPVLVTANDYGQRLYNGDMGVTIRRDDGRLRVVVPGADGLQEFATTRLPDVQTVHAMTVHKSQGSQAEQVSVVMPPERLAAAHPRALLHGGDPGQGEGVGHRHRGSRSAPRSARKVQRASRAGEPARRLTVRAISD